MLSRRWLRLGLLLAILAFALVLRTLGVRMGLPYGHHADEGWIADSVIHMRDTRSLVPETYQYGAPMIMSCLLVDQVFTHFVHGVSPDDGEMLRWMARGVTVAFKVSALPTALLPVAALALVPGHTRFVPRLRSTLPYRALLVGAVPLSSGSSPRL